MMRGMSESTPFGGEDRPRNQLHIPFYCRLAEMFQLSRACWQTGLEPSDASDPSRLRSERYVAGQ